MVQLIFHRTDLKPLVFFYNNFFKIIFENVKLINKTIAQVSVLNVIFVKLMQNCLIERLVKVSLKISLFIKSFIKLFVNFDCIIIHIVGRYPINFLYFFLKNPWLLLVQIKMLTYLSMSTATVTLIFTKILKHFSFFSNRQDVLRINKTFHLKSCLMRIKPNPLINR